ncbi:MAG TPA: hypothetical protein VHZ53_11935 [Steroidobacteraceae bacterium]|jgi:hypothetical protein|nr:hypothetical protein [Steroidobacteraceae bacterium]
MMPKASLTLIAALALAGHAKAASAPLTQKALRPAIESYLKEKGNFCLNKYDWPIEVQDGDRPNGTRDAIQMPALEKVGLVTASRGEPGLTRYELTKEGRKYYRTQKIVIHRPGDQSVEHSGDLCAAKLVLDRVVSWDAPRETSAAQSAAAPQSADHDTQVIVRYTYKVVSAPDWTRDPEVAKAFPMMRRIFDGAGSQELEQSVTWSGRRWEAVTP